MRKRKLDITKQLLLSVFLNFFVHSRKEFSQRRGGAVIFAAVFNRHCHRIFARKAQRVIGRGGGVEDIALKLQVAAHIPALSRTALRERIERLYIRRVFFYIFIFEQLYKERIKILIFAVAHEHFVS